MTALLTLPPSGLACLVRYHLRLDATAVDVTERADLTHLFRRGGLHGWQPHLLANRISPKFVCFRDAVVADCGQGGRRAYDLQILTLATFATSVSRSLIDVVIRPLVLLLLLLLAASLVECVRIVIFICNCLLVGLGLLNRGGVHVRRVRTRMDG